jgi:hypothetical protein
MWARVTIGFVFCPFFLSIIIHHMVYFRNKIFKKWLKRDDNDDDRDLIVHSNL